MEKIKSSIKQDIHGEPINLNCDYMHEDYVAVSPDNVIIDVIKITNLSQFEAATNPPDAWVTDAVRCEAHFTDTIPLPTDGYEEAVIIVDVTDNPDASATVDATDLTVIDYSPTDHGPDPPPINARLLNIARANDDYGICRLNRLRELVPAYRLMGKEVYADLVMEQIEKARKC